MYIQSNSKYFLKSNYSSVKSFFTSLTLVTYSFSDRPILGFPIFTNFLEFFSSNFFLCFSSFSIFYFYCFSSLITFLISY